MEVKLHDIGEGMTEAIVTQYLVEIGDVVTADQPLLEVQTDKMTAEIPSPQNGTINEILIREGDMIKVGTTILTITLSEPNHIHPEKTNDKQLLSRTSTYKIDVPAKNMRILASPYTRKIAREHGVDIEIIQGSGEGGRITDNDVFQYINGTRQEDATVDIGDEITAQRKKHSGEEDSPEIIPSSIPFRGRRKQIAKKMEQSLRTITHCTHFEEVDVTEVMELREKLKEKGNSVSISAFFIKAISIALQDFPIFNSKLDESKEVIHLEPHHNIGIATDTEDGLIVPVISHIERKSLTAIHSEMKELTKKALENTLSVKDVVGGTFTISNVGPLGGSIGATPIINHPEAGLLAFHKTKKRPVVNDKDEIVIRSMMNISMSFDHRVADGATAVKFTNRFVELIEDPTMMMLEMV